MDKNKIGIAALVVAVVIAGFALFRETRIVVDVNIPREQSGQPLGFAAGTVSDFTSANNAFSGAIYASSTAQITGVLSTFATSSCRKVTTGTICAETKGGIDYAYVQQTFTTATNTPVIIRSPFGATATTTFRNILVQITGGGPAMRFDIATTSLTNFATTTSVVVKNILVALNNTYTGLFNPFLASTTPSGVLPGFYQEQDKIGESTWFLQPVSSTTPSNEGLMLRIASSSVAQSYTGTVSVEFVKP